MSCRVPDDVKSKLHEGETVLKLVEHGVLRWKRYEVVTDRRTLEVKGDEIVAQRDLPPEETLSRLLETGEELVMIQGCHGHVDGTVDGDFVDSRGDAMAVTNRRLIVIAFGEAGPEALWALPLSDARGIDIARLQGGLGTVGGTAMVLWLTPREQIRVDPDRVSAVHISLSDPNDLAALEPIPRTICALTGLPLCPPERLYDEGADQFTVGFFPKTDLKWPSRCAHCGSEDRDLDPREIRATKGPFDAAPIGVSEAVLQVPCCHECRDRHTVWAVVGTHFDGVTVQLHFGSRDFAEEFCELNSRPGS